MTGQDLLDKYWNPEEGTWRWPLNDGFADGKWEVAHSIPREARLDRIGEVSQDRGDFMATSGDSYPERALAPGTSGDYHVFRGTGKQLPDDWELRYGKAGEAFGRPGGGTQWVVVDKEGHHVLIDTLLTDGYLEPEW
jgi:hypothetical protein